MATVMGGVGYGIYFTAKVRPAFAFTLYVIKEQGNLLHQSRGHVESDLHIEFHRDHRQRLTTYSDTSFL